jgi:signal transduction histidine kinase
LNLVINAIQAAPQGGEVRVGVDANDSRVRIVVEDDGPGLPATDLQRVFDPFYTTKQRGTGLGLSIAFQIADQHGGDLHASNRRRGGARFCLELPPQATPPPPSGPRARREER